MSSPDGSGSSSLSTWSALCKDCRNSAVRSKAAGQPKRPTKKAKDDVRQPEYEYSDVHASRQHERGQSLSDRCPECRKRHKKEIAAFPVAYIDFIAIGEASKYVTDPDIGPTGPLGGLGPLPDIHSRRTESVDLASFALGLTSANIVELLEKMVTHQVVVLEAGTGTGKSTLAPFRLMNPPDGAPYRPTDIGPIVVTEPRVPATTEVAQFVGEAMCFGHDPAKCFSHVGPGYPVGYQCEGKKVWDEACSLIYVTDGTMVNWITNGELARIGTIIVDEAHERSENIDLILTLLASKLPRYPHLRVVIASATIDKDYFVKFFSQTPSIRVGHYLVEAAKTIGYGVPLFADIDFTSDVLENGFIVADPADPDGPSRVAFKGWPDEPNPEEDGKSLRSMTRDVFLDLRSPAPSWPRNVAQAAVTQTMKILEATDRGDVLVFLPSKKSVLDARRDIAEAVDNSGSVGIVHVHWLMRETPKDEKKLALASCKPGERKVVVASNLAETSLTIAGIKYVVDSGRVIQAGWDSGLAVSHAEQKSHSQSGVRQRWGRVGRKTHGWVFPLYSLADYLQLPRDTPAGSTQTNLEGTLLKLIAAGEDPANVVFPADFQAQGLVRDRFAQDTAGGFTRERARALAALQANGAVNADGKTLSRLGAELTRSRLDTEKAIALMFADRLACVPEVAMTLLALGGHKENERDKGRLAGPERMLATNADWPLEWNVHARRCHEALAIGCVDDLDLVIRVFAEWKAAPDPSKWCAQWWINEEVLDTLESAAAKLMDSLAPGMSKEATRALDPRLAVRARAAITRALGSLRFIRSSDGLWWSANPNQPDGLYVSPFHLIPAPDELVGLARERPNDRAAGPVIPHGELLGLVRHLPWATEGEPTDFELLRRVSLRRREAMVVNDPARALRTRFPIGARVRITADRSGGETIETLTAGLAKPIIEGVRDVLAADDTSEDRIVYTSETGSSDDDLDVNQPKAGAGTPEEELRLTPIPVTQLENPDLEDFTGHTPYLPSELAAAESSDLDAPTRFADVHGNEMRATDAQICMVIGYRVQADSVDLVVEPSSTTASASRQIGDVVRAIATGLAVTNLGFVNEFRQCDERGDAVLGEPFWVAGANLDAVIGGDVDAVPIGTIWSCRFIPASTNELHLTASLTEAALDRLTIDSPVTSRVRAGTIASVVGVLTGEMHRDWRGEKYVIASTDAFAPDFAPRFAISAYELDRAALAAEPGSRVKLDLRFEKFSRRSGKWRPDDVKRLVEEHPDLFLRGTKAEFLSLASELPLSEDALDHLLAVDPSSQLYERNAWQLWETSRRVGVRSLSALGEADVAPEVASSLRTSANLTNLKRQFSVGITISDAGKVVVSGSTADVTAALGRLRDCALEPTWTVELPSRPDCKYPRFPKKEVVTDSLAALGELGQAIASGYDPRVGQVELRNDEAARAANAIAERLRAVATYYCVRLTFAESRGFYAFQNKERWTTRIAPRLSGLERWLIADGTTWGIFASTAEAVIQGIGRVRAELPAVAFDVSALETFRPSVKRVPPLTDRFEVAYITPPAPEADEPVSVAEPLVPTQAAERPTPDGPAIRELEQGSDLDNAAGGGDEAPLSRRKLLALYDGCKVYADGTNVVIDGPDGRSVTIARDDWRLHSSPRHWLREGGIGQ